MKPLIAKPHGLNQQAAEKIIHGNHAELDVVGVWRTIQGEGPFAGMPCIFVRLAGCNLQCPMCDTDYTSDRKTITSHALVEKIKQTKDPVDNLVVLTGGEPFRQDLSLLVNLLSEASFHVQIETNGTILPSSDFPFVNNTPFKRHLTIVCSPKTVLHRKIAWHVNAWKYVLKAGDVADNGLPLHALDYSIKVAHPPDFVDKKDIYLQPLDEGNETKNLKNLEATVKSCMKHGYRLCLQMHKYAGLS